MKRKEKITCGVLILLFSLTFVTPANAETTWGFEIDEDYIYELKKFNIYGIPLVFQYKEETMRHVTFNSCNNTGYTYNLYNYTNIVAETSTTFSDIEIDNETTLVLPEGLPIALPMTFEEIPDYLDYFGQAINQTETMFFLDNIMPNIPEHVNSTYLAVYSEYDEKFLDENLDLYAPTANPSVLDILLGGINLGDLPIAIPTNITEFALNITSAFDTPTGLFDHLTIKLRSLSTDEYNYVDHFDIDIVYGLYNPPEIVYPEIEGPASFSFEKGTIGNNITWVLTDDNPTFYQIYIDDSPFIADSWESPETVVLNVDHLTVGVYNITLEATDVNGNSATNTVIVTVISSDITDTETSLPFLTIIISVGIANILHRRKK